MENTVSFESTETLKAVIEGTLLIAIKNTVGKNPSSFNASAKEQKEEKTVYFTGFMAKMVWDFLEKRKAPVTREALQGFDTVGFYAPGTK